MGPAAPYKGKPEYMIAQECANDIADLLAPQVGVGAPGPARGPAQGPARARGRGLQGLQRGLVTSRKRRSDHQGDARPRLSQSGAYYDIWLDGEKFVTQYMEVGDAGDDGGDTRPRDPAARPGACRAKGCDALSATRLLTRTLPFASLCRRRTPR